MNKAQKDKLSTLLFFAMWLGTWLDSGVRAFMQGEWGIGIFVALICVWVYTVVLRRHKEMVRSMDEGK